MTTYSRIMMWLCFAMMVALLVLQVMIAKRTNRIHEAFDKMLQDTKETTSTFERDEK